VREHDVPARIVGDEFAVLLRNPGPPWRFEVGEAVRRASAISISATSRCPGDVSASASHATAPMKPIHALVAAPIVPSSEPSAPAATRWSPA